MDAMKFLGHMLMKLRPGVDTRAPAHIDVLEGLRRPESRIDGNGAIDRALHACASAVRARRCLHASAHSVDPGWRHLDYSRLERECGLDRILEVEVAEPERLDEAVRRVRETGCVEWAMAEPLACLPLLARAPEEPEAGAMERAREMVGASRALALEAGARDVPVAVIDTGVAIDHREFAGRLWTGYDTVDLGIGRVAPGITLVGDSVGRDFCARDETGHGTHVAGIIGARGISMPQGIGGRSPLIPIRALATARSDDGTLFGIGALADIDAAIKVAVDRGARVINMSFGTAAAELDDISPAPHADVVEYASRNGCICVAAMGNTGDEERYFPAALPGVIAVGSVDETGRRSRFSTRGAHIALSAPGESVLSAGIRGYALSTGTSHAAPFVSGAIALLLSRAHRHGIEPDTRLVRELLCLSARGGEPNTDTGWGVLDIPAALGRLDAIAAHHSQEGRP